MRNFGKLAAFRSLCFYKVLYKLLGEYTARGKIVVILLKGTECFGKRRGKSLELRLLLLGEVEEIEVIRSPSVFVRIDLILDSVKTCHKNCGIAEIGVAGRIGIAELEAALLGLFCIGGNTDDRTAVGRSVTYGYGSLKAGDKALE